MTMHREQTWKYRANKLYKFTDTMKQTYAELENSNVIFFFFFFDKGIIIGQSD